MAMTRWWMMLLTGAFLALFFVAYVHRDSNKHSNSKFRTPRYQLLKAPEVKNSEEDDRGWMTSPFTVFDGGINCLDMHLGTINPGKTRGNHRHYSKSELLVTWGAKTYWKVEDPSEPKGYVERIIPEDQAFAVLLPRGIAHIVKNMDENKPVNLIGCSDSHFDVKHPNTDYNIWKDE